MRRGLEYRVRSLKSGVWGENDEREEGCIVYINIKKWGGYVGATWDRNLVMDERKGTVYEKKRNKGLNRRLGKPSVGCKEENVGKMMDERKGVVLVEKRNK